MGDKAGFNNNTAAYLAAGISVVSINCRFISQVEADDDFQTAGTSSQSR